MANATQSIMLTISFLLCKALFLFKENTYKHTHMYTNTHKYTFCFLSSLSSFFDSENQNLI